MTNLLQQGENSVSRGTLMEKISLSQMGEEGQIFCSELTYQSPNGLIITTHCIFLGLKFLVRNEEKDEIPCQGMRKIQGIF